MKTRKEVRATPKYLIGVLGFIAFAMMILLLVVHYHTEGYRHYAIEHAMITSAQTAAINSEDHSARVATGLTELDTGTFEGQFKTLFQQNVGVKLTGETFAFHYLSDNGDVKAIQIVVTDDRGTAYPMTWRVDNETENKGGQS